MSTLCIGISHILLHISTLFWIPDPMVGGGLEPLFPPSRSGNVFPTMSTHTCLHLSSTSKHSTTILPAAALASIQFFPNREFNPIHRVFHCEKLNLHRELQIPKSTKAKIGSSAFKAFYLHNINNSLGKWSFINWSLLKLQYFAAFLPLLNTGWVSVWPYGICQNFPQVLIHLLDPLYLLLPPAIHASPPGLAKVMFPAFSSSVLTSSPDHILSKTVLNFDINFATEFLQ